MRRFFGKKKETKDDNTEEEKKLQTPKVTQKVMPSSKEEQKKGNDKYSEGSYEGPGTLDPQDDVDWSTTDIFPSDKALTLHFVNQNPQAEDLEEFI